MTKENLTAFFKNSNLVSSAVAAEIADHFEFKIIPKNQFLLLAGKISDEYLFLDKGYMRAFAHDTEGNEVTTNFYSQGQVVFEVSSF